MRQKYIKFMIKYEQIGDMEKLSQNKIDNVCYFISFHIVKNFM